MIGCLQIRRDVTVAAAGGNEVTLLRCGTDAATSAAEAGRAALRLALVVLEHEEIVGTDLNIGTQQRLIWRRSAPVRQTICRLLHDIIIGANRLVVIARRRRIVEHVIHESLRADRVICEAIHHQEIRQQKKCQHHENECNSGRHLL